jgi:hypothetical protein
MLQNDYGILIMRNQEPKRNKYRKPFTRYSLAGGKAEVLAVCLLNSLRFKRGMMPVVLGHYSTLTNQAA